MTKRRRRKTGGSRAKTGAPPASFLLHLRVETPIIGVIAKTRKDRQQFKSLSTGQVFQQTRLLLLDLAERVMRPSFDPKMLGKEAEALSALGVFSADIIEQLAFSNSIAASELHYAAQKRGFWPVNLGLGKKRGKDGHYKTTLAGADKAKGYLEKIDLGYFVNPSTNLMHFFDPEASPFRRAAELLLHAMIDFREHGLWRQFIDGTPTPWAKKLLSLGDEMRQETADEWWSVAKLWMYEQWDANRGYFEPLAKHLKLDNAKFTPSLVRRRVIDDSLKKAFKALATPSDS